MKPVTTIPVQDWMISPETRAVMTPLNEGSPEPQALFVGGSVRNALLGKPVGDIDIATMLTPPEVMQRLQAAGFKVIPTGIGHGTITAVSAGKPYEITTLRRDVETDGRRAVVAFSKDWAEDAARRDFTMNTLLADTAGRIYDPTGAGLSDLQSRRVIFVGDPAQRIAEDVLRILRFFRFHALYGRGAPDEGALSACRAQAHKIPGLSRERITEEFFKIVSVDNPVDILRIFFNNGIIPDFQCNAYNPEILSFYCKFSKKINLPDRLFILFGLSMDNIRVAEKLLLVPKAIMRKIQALQSVLNSGQLTSEQAVKAGVYRHGRDAMSAALLIRCGEGAAPKDTLDKYLDIAQSWPIPVFPVTGDDLMAQGFTAGPELGKKLKDLEKAWILDGFPVSGNP